MAATQWVVLKQKWCDVAQAQAELIEERVYPQGIIPDVPGYRVVNRHCSHGMLCNSLGCQCKWAYLGDDVDHFAGISA